MKENPTDADYIEPFHPDSYSNCGTKNKMGWYSRTPEKYTLTGLLTAGIIMFTSGTRRRNNRSADVRDNGYSEEFSRTELIATMIMSTVLERARLLFLGSRQTLWKIPTTLTPTNLG
ncbi:hypothetical protein BDV23DRAFT_187748 [Aspergillus alliaceus]|uniref:Uncharacterized protein n=1 Tax=Petromyces alliaceus TaxID=209559 RepID=A0A5N7BVT1_PETAA|nr:uncharacterized protein BDW43DRAFT_275188 [Aspergillus alliaceus]KAB8233805.1 hypothetical protein BDW43DRAFT_275188 [Aspergillus alliaceus]KAE8385930.1 hypothetical protein BDV23DRAFT_187748 [Aspergillus alliaceus]